MIIDRDLPNTPKSSKGWAELATQSAVLTQDDGLAGIIAALMAIYMILREIEGDLDDIKRQGGAGR